MLRRLHEATGSVVITVNGQPHRAAPGDTVAVALLASGVDVFRTTARHGVARGPHCGMGVCFDCLVTIDGVPNRQACLEPVADGMSIETGRGLPDLTHAKPS